MARWLKWQRLVGSNIWTRRSIADYEDATSNCWPRTSRSGPKPVWDLAGRRVLFSDIPKNMIWEWSQSAGLKEFLKPSGYTGAETFTGREPGSNGLAFNKAGELVMCQHGDRRVAKWSTASSSRSRKGTQASD